MTSFNDLRDRLNEVSEFDCCITTENLGDSVTSIALALINNIDVHFYGETKVVKNRVQISDQSSLFERLMDSKSKLFFQTSGTTGTPKSVVKDFDHIIRGVRISPELLNSSWGFCYSTRHISGLYIILQAILTNSKLIDLRNLSSKDLGKQIEEARITNISAPATFYKLNFPLETPISSVLKVTNGGEPLDEVVIRNIKKTFPNASIRNVYASTEFGSLLISKSNQFKIPDRLLGKVKIEDETIWVHKSLLSKFKGSNEEWYNTKDKVKMITETSFEIIGRSSEDVKVLGHLVSLRKVEKKIGSLPGISLVKVTALPHNVFGNLLSCEVVLKKPESISKPEIKFFIKNELRDYERPLKLQIVEKINITTSGKIQRY